MSQHFLTPFVAQFAYALSVREGQGQTIEQAAAAIASGMEAFCMDYTEIGIARRAAMEIRRADRRGVRLPAGRALTSAQAAHREDPLSRPACFATVGYGTGRSEPSELYQRTGKPRSVLTRLPDVFQARTRGMRQGHPVQGAWQPGWSRARVMTEARIAARRLP